MLDKKYVLCYHYTSTQESDLIFEHFGGFMKFDWFKVLVTIAGLAIFMGLVTKVNKGLREPVYTGYYDTFNPSDMVKIQKDYKDKKGKDVTKEIWPGDPEFKEARTKITHTEEVSRLLAEEARKR